MKKTRNFHLPLPEPLYQELRAVADAAGEPATTVARMAIQAWLRERRRAAVREAIAAYAVSVGGTADDLDQDLEAAALEALRPGRRRRR